MRDFLIVFIILGTSALCFSQSKADLHPCGAPSYKSEWLKNYQKNPSAFPAKSNAEIYLPLSIAVVGTDQGTGLYNETALLTAMCTLSEDFEDSEVNFFLQEYRIIFDSEYFEHEDVLTGAEKMFLYDRSDALNCYVVGNPAGNCGYNLPYAGVALSTACMGETDHTWAHEMGHALSVQHPFLGWEGGVGTDGTTPNYTEPAPETVTYDYTFFQDVLILDTLIIDTAIVEKVDGSNCHIAGDGFCDTKPDYLAISWGCDGSNDSYQEQTDPNGVKFKSDGTLIMSYAFDGCSSRFTPEQMAAMRANAEDEKADLVVNDPPAVYLDEDLVVTLGTPYDSDFDYKDIEFSWDAVEGADHYLLQVGLGSTLQLVYFDTIVSSTEAVVPSLPDNFDYFWRVAPFTKLDFCDLPFAEITHFEPTDVSASANTTLDESIVLIPNIISGQRKLRLSSNNFNAIGKEYRIIDMQGNVFDNGKLDSYDISLDDFMPAGLYVLQLDGKNSKVNLKFVVQ